MPPSMVQFERRVERARWSGVVVARGEEGKKASSFWRIRRVSQ